MVDQSGNSVELPPVRFNEIILKDHQTYSLAYEFKIQGADIEEEEQYTFEVTMGYKETDVHQV